MRDTLRVALIAPPFGGAGRGVPLGLAQLATAVKLHGFDVYTLDLTVVTGEGVLLSFLQRTSPQVVGISTVCATYLQAVAVAETCRAVLGRSVKIIAGGPHVTFGADVVLSRHECFDACVLGEAEHSFVELCRAFCSPDSSGWQAISGIAFREGSLVHRSLPRPLISKLDELPLPERAYFPEDSYKAVNSFEIGKIKESSGIFDVDETEKADVMASRGCPHSCGFCSTKEFWQKKYRSRSPEHVFSELKQLRAAGKTHIYFNDDIFSANRSWVMRLCELLIRYELGLKWACGTRVDRVDRTLLTMMRDAGCVYIYYGVETGVSSINKMQSKGIKSAQIAESFSLLRDVGIYSSAAIIFGLPGETIETARGTIEWIRDIVCPDEVYISKAACYPGTKLAQFYGVDAADYEWKENGKSKRGLQFGTGGIYTPFFNNIDTISHIWDYALQELSHLSVGFGDDYGQPTASLLPISRY